jgi:glycosyltransferase involved in cell wall biosynthesis
MTTQHRILVIAHGHPDFSLGGGEVAAYNLFQGYRRHPDVERAWFLARHDRGRGPTGQISPRREDEYLWEQGIGDWFTMRSAHRASVTDEFTELLKRARPTIVHLHHYAHLGLQIIPAIRRALPDARIILTLHEMMAICFQNGQMVKADSLRMCSRESPDDCIRCFPNRSLEDFWLRKHRYTAIFRLVDHFITPSEFLRQRYIDWGLEPDRISVLENGQVHTTGDAPRPLLPGETRNRFGFFGQVNPYKGVDVLLRALASMPKAARKTLQVEIHGSNLDYQKPEFREKIMELRAPLERDGVLRWVGPYEPSQLSERMLGVDWVVIPSIWWENSPMVIQEAFMHGRPVIASNIGGMAEKVTDGVNGRHVPVGNPLAWSGMLQALAGDDAQWQRLRAGITLPPGADEAAEQHLASIL